MREDVGLTGVSQHPLGTMQNAVLWGVEMWGACGCKTRGQTLVWDSICAEVSAVLVYKHTATRCDFEVGAGLRCLVGVFWSLVGQCSDSSSAVVLGQEARVAGTELWQRGCA